MLIGLNQENERIYIEDTVAGLVYYCPICHKDLILKKGEIRRHHFAHKNSDGCYDSWHYDMSEWHQNWQNQFSEEHQEIIFEHSGEKHRADVFINNTIIEFQHSRILAQDFINRNLFYKKLGYQIIWIFDATELYGSKKIVESGESHYSYKWSNPFRGLQEYNLDSTTTIYLQISRNTWDIIPNYRDLSYEELGQYGGELLEISWKNRNCTHFRSNNRPEDFCDVDFLEKFNSGLAHDKNSPIGDSIINL